MITQVSNSLYHQLITVYGDSLALPEERDSILSIRKKAFLAFKDQGFPTTKMEEWKYTNLQAVVNQPYALNDGLAVSDVDISKAGVKGLDAYKLVLVNGHYRADLSDPIEEAGVFVADLKEVTHQELFLSHFAQYADFAESPFVALNTALCESGLFLHVAEKVALKKSIQIIQVASADENLFNQTRNLIVVDKGAKVEVIETFISEGNGISLNNAVSEWVVAEEASIQHYTIQTASANARYINYTEVHQAAHSLYNNYNCSFSEAAFVRNNIQVRLNDQAVESHLYGLVLSSQDQLIDNHTVVDHRMPHCESYEWYKNIAQDTSTIVFNGKIFVQPDAQKTNAFQQNNNMLMGEKATVYTKPQLEIFADDVKCSHGCTMGQFDEEALFYLRARGVGEESARELLIHAFAFDVTEKFSNDIMRAYIDQLIGQSLVLQ